MPPRRVLPIRHAREGIISYSDTNAVSAVGGAAVPGAGEAAPENNYMDLSDENGGDDISFVEVSFY